jgi:hypothetical protein
MTTLSAIPISSDNPAYHGYTANFVPQAWIRDYAVEIDAEGDQQWPVNPAFLAERVQSVMDWRVQLGRPIDADEALRLVTETSTDESDELRSDPAAPAWIADHAGPFYCEAWKD